jgi:UDP-4-amino-4-deoxy-L-arabinose-oxoglutarate aminotransferase
MTGARDGNSPIPLFRCSVPPAARARLLATLDSGWLGYGPQCRLLEERFTADRGGWALATSSCTSALYLAGRLVKALAGASQPEIIVPSISFVASGMAFLQAGVLPVIAAVDANDLLLGVDGVRQALTPRTRAILAVHLYGQRCRELPALRALADEHGLLLIEDCAHRIDLLDGAAPLGDLLCYSFNAVKELPGGEGGLLWGRERRHESWVRPVSNLGLAVDTMQRAAALRHGDYAFAAEPGLKLRSNDIAAALVDSAIDALPASRAQRREQFQRYDRLLSAAGADARPIERGDDDSCLMYVIRVAPETRDGVRAAMACAGVATSVHYPSLARHPLFGNEQPGACCGDQDECIVTLPTFAELTADDQRRVVDALASALAGVRLAAPPAASAGPRALTLG